MFQLQPKVNHTEVFRDIKKSVKNAVCRFCRYSFVGDAEDQSLGGINGWVVHLQENFTEKKNGDN